MKNYKIKLLVIALFILLGITISHAQNQKEKTFNLGKSGQLVVSLDYGDITINPTSSDEVIVKYDEDGEYASFRFVQNGNTLTITSGGDYENEDITVSVPSSINLDLDTDGGNVKITGNISGKVELSTDGGDIETKDIQGNAELNTAGGEVATGNINGNASISSGGGDLQIGTISGEANLNTGGGNIMVYDVRKGLKIRTGGGNVKAGNVGGVFTVTTGGGNVEVKNVSSTTTVTTGGGNISISESVGKTNVTTGGGNLSLKGISGGVRCVTGSGDVYVELKPDGKSGSKIKSGNGSITLYVPGDAKATITAKVRNYEQWGDDNDRHPITSDFKVTTEDKSSHSLRTVYVINGGGSDIEIETISGNIKIKKMK